MLVYEYEIFKMKEGERVGQMFERLSVIINNSHALRRIISEKDLNMKILRTLLRSWQSKENAIQRRGFKNR